MKTNKIQHGHGRQIVLALAIIALLLGIGGSICFDKLRIAYIDRCEIRNMAEQVMITSGKMVHPTTIAEELGLKVGANLAMIDFKQKRNELLARIPNLRTVKITRYLPDKVSIVAEERTPIARLGIKGSKGISGRVVDTEGVVFICQRGTHTLPTIREPFAPGISKGSRIQKRLLAALRLVELCREPEFAELGILEVDTSKHDFLVATLQNYSKLKICWDEMDESTPNARKDLSHRLTLLRNAYRAKMTPEIVIWNATIPDRIFADTQRNL